MIKHEKITKVFILLCFFLKGFLMPNGDLVLYLGFKYFDRSRLSSTRAKAESCSDGLRYPKPKTGFWKYAE